jgi:hypothetical protein
MTTALLFHLNLQYFTDITIKILEAACLATTRLDEVRTEELRKGLKQSASQAKPS